MQDELRADLEAAGILDTWIQSDELLPAGAAAEVFSGELPEGVAADYAD
jgi:hypothetical protein